MMKQFTYTSVDASQKPGGGWQIQLSDGFDAEELDRELRVLGEHERIRTATDLPVVLPPDQRAGLPTRLMLTRVDTDTRRLSQERPAGIDGSGRPGNTFTHTLIAPWDALAYGFETPIRAYGSPFWLAPYGAPEVAAVQLPEPKFFPEFLEYDWADVLEKHPETFYPLLNALEQTTLTRCTAPGAPRQLIVLKTTDTHRGIQWMEAIMSCCFPVDAWNITFSTYESDLSPRQALQLLHSVHLDIVLTDHDHQWSENLLVLDLDADTPRFIHGTPPAVTDYSWGTHVQTLLAEVPQDSARIASALDILETFQDDYFPTPSRRLGFGPQVVTLERQVAAGTDLTVHPAMLDDLSSGSVPEGTRVGEVTSVALPMLFRVQNAPMDQLVASIEDIQDTTQKHQLVKILMRRLMQQPADLARFFPYDWVPAVETRNLTLPRLLGDGSLPPDLTSQYPLDVLMLTAQAGLSLTEQDYQALASLWWQTLHMPSTEADQVTLYHKLTELKSRYPQILAEFASHLAGLFRDQRLDDTYTTLIHHLAWANLHQLDSDPTLARIANRAWVERIWATTTYQPWLQLADSLEQDAAARAQAMVHYVSTGEKTEEQLLTILDHYGTDAALRTAFGHSSTVLHLLANIFVRSSRHEFIGSVTVEELSDFYLDDATLEPYLHDEGLNSKTWLLESHSPHISDTASQLTLVTSFIEVAQLAGSFEFIHPERLGNVFGQALVLAAHPALHLIFPLLGPAALGELEVDPPQRALTDTETQQVGLTVQNIQQAPAMVADDIDFRHGLDEVVGMHLPQLALLAAWTICADEHYTPLGKKHYRMFLEDFARTTNPLAQLIQPTLHELFPADGDGGRWSRDQRNTIESIKKSLRKALVRRYKNPREEFGHDAFGN